jgi:hypothetical protein
MAVYDDMRMEPATGSQGYMLADDAIGPHLTILADLGSGMNYRA